MDMRVLLAAVLLLAAVACGGDAGGDESFAVYHLERALGRPGEEGELRCGPPRSCPGVIAQPAPREVRYEVLAPPGLGEESIDRASAPATATPVSVMFTVAGTAAFARLTREIARYGGRDQGWHHLAVVLGGEVIAYPHVDFDAYPNGIVGAPGLQLTAVDAADARALARRLRGDQ
jgi:hypothetical protein